MYHYFFVFCYFILWLLSQIINDEENEEESDSELSSEDEYDSGLEVESITSGEDEDEPHITEPDIKSVMNYSGWRSRTKVHVRYEPEFIHPEKRSQSGYYEGTIKRKKGRKFDIFFPSTANTDTVVPTETQWHYSEQTLQEWPSTENIILEKNTLRPFQYKKERVGNWSGAKTCSTETVPLKIWSIPNSHYVHIGHIGVYECVSADREGTIQPIYGIPKPNQKYFFGRSKTKDATHFSEFRLVCRTPSI